MVAVLTTAVIMPNIQQRVDSHRQANIVYKITQATNNMKNLGLLGKFNSTDEFADELVKHLKITKRCDANNIAECWPSSTVRTSEGEEYEVSKAKTGKQLGFKNRTSDNVGLVLADGASIIMTYDTDSEGLDVGDELSSIGINLPVGGGYEEMLEYTTNTTGALAFVMDVNGGKGPNSETIGTKYYDIRNLNGAHFSTGCGGTEVDGKCIVQLSSYSPINCSDSANSKYCGNASGYSNDYWAGANKACQDLGMELPSSGALKSLCQNSKDVLGITSGFFWSSTEQTKNIAYTVSFSSCRANYAGYKTNSSEKAVCVGN